MLDRSSTRRLIRDTLDACGMPYRITDSMVDLIQMTFLMESDATRLFDEGHPNRHGFMMMTYVQMVDIVSDYIRPNQFNRMMIQNVCLIDAKTDSAEDMFEALAYNLAFQVAITFLWYERELSEFPVGIEDVATAYLSHYRKSHPNARVRDEIVKRFIEHQSTSR